MNKIKKTTHWMIVMKGEHLKDGIPISEESLENALYAFTRKITYAIDGGGVIDMSDVKGILPNYLKESDHLPSGVSPTYENCKNFFGIRYQNAFKNAQNKAQQRSLLRTSERARIKGL